MILRTTPFACRFQIHTEIDGRSIVVEFTGTVDRDDRRRVTPECQAYTDVEGSATQLEWMPWNDPYHELEEEAQQRLAERYRQHCQGIYECQERDDT